MIIVNFSTKEYRRGQQRLSASLDGHKQLMLNDYVSIGSPTHSESPYQFKCHCISTAWNHDPVVLWVDSSMWRVGNISEIEDIILRDGFFGSEAGHYAGRWTNQFTRNYFKVTEQEMVQGLGGITLFSAGLLGLNRNNEIAIRFFDEWIASAKAGCFKGDWQDHRHDMTCASIIATRLGFKYQRGGKHMGYVGPGYNNPEPGVIFKLQGI